ncbi:MAG: hypothetical protein H7841_00510 [Magnetospirillum sp. WYHS-4]
MSIALAILLVALAFAAVWRRLDRLERLARPQWAIPLWCGLFVLEYVILGPRSFIYMDDEGDLIVTYLHFLTESWDGSQYIHGLGGGADAQAGFLIGGERVSLDRLLFSVLPLWLAIAGHKVIVAATGMTGTYLLCRHGIGVRIPVALAAGALFTVAHSRLVICTFGSSFGWAVIPLVVHAVLFRQDRPHYWPGVVGVSLFSALVTIPTQGVLPLVASLAMISLLAGRWSWKAVGATFVVLAAIAANWAESLLGMLRMALVVSKATPWDAGYPDPAAVLVNAVEIYLGAFFSPAFTGLGMVPATAAWAFAVLTMLALGDRGLWRILGAFALPFLFVVGFLELPWEWLGLESVRGVTYSYFILAMVPVGMVVAAKAADSLADRWAVPERRRAIRVLAALGFAIPLGVLAWYKVFATWQFLTVGGQSAYWTVENLRQAAWKPAGLHRAIVLRNKSLIIEPNVAFAFYGQEVFDGFTNFPFRSYRDYWLEGVNPRGIAPTAFMSPDYWDSAHKTYRIDQQLDLNLLGAANVQFIFSPVPLEGGGLRLVDGPTGVPSGAGLESDDTYGNRPGALRRLEIAWRRAMALGHRIPAYGKIYVYELPRSLPRAWSVSGLTVVADDLPEGDFLRAVGNEALDRRLVIRKADAEILGSAEVGSPEVRSVRAVPNGYDLDVAAPTGGIVVVNALFQPYFSAVADGHALPIAPANGVQTALAVPVGATHIRLRYHRPTLAEVLRKRWLADRVDDGKGLSR